ncbi:uncharacterized protein LOC113360421 [Papaver somniferum]|uniref:uncharacterized protein LOC113360421 n=1 Tax=Papaver somniferum TaxID=3469 RepID=UPI000E6F59A4|nr:uncharacterized protein LOC113360421 [Papaver somniferum]
MASAKLQIRKDVAGLITFISRWCPETHTAICRWGEMTISLESVAIMLNLPITGNLNIILSDEEEKMHAILVAKSAGFVRKDYETKCFYNWWVFEWFPDESEPDQVNSMLHVAAFLSLWLSRDIFDDGSGKKEIRQELIKLAIKLAKGVVLPIGGLFIGSLYTHLDHLAADMYASNGYMKVDSYVHVTFLQTWLWELLKNYALNPLDSFPESYGGSRILRWLNKRPRPGSNLIDFLENAYAVNFRPWSPVHVFIIQADAFASAPNTTLLSAENNMSVGEIVFMRSGIPRHVPSFFRGSYEAVPYNIDRSARHMGFDQGVSFLRQSAAPEELLSTALDASVLAPDKILPFLLSERNPATTSRYNTFWQDEFLAIYGFVNDVVKDPCGKPSPAILAKHPLLRSFPQLSGNLLVQI